MSIDAVPEPTTPEPTPAEEKTPAPTALAVVEPVAFERELEPRSSDGAYRMSKVLFNSRLYQRFGNAEAIMAVIVRGREMGLGALTALDCFHVVEGRPCASANFIIAKAKADPDCDYFQLVDSTATSATWETKNRRNPKPTRFTYTIEQARAAGLVKDRGNWAARPEDMLIKTAGSKLARIEYPGGILGIYSSEEMGGIE